MYLLLLRSRNKIQRMGQWSKQFFYLC